MISTIVNKLILTEENILNLILNDSSRKDSSLFTYFNQSCFNIYCNNLEYRKIIDDNFIVFADGVGIFLALRFLTGERVKRFNATDLYSKILSKLLQSGKKIFIIGGNFNHELIDSKITNCGYVKGYFEPSYINEIAGKINDKKPDVVFLGLGVPRQETITNELAKKTSAKMFICVGNFFEFYLGTKKRIPRIFRNTGIEWMYRLIHEPKRLWKRYVIGIPMFLVRILNFKFFGTKPVAEE